MGLPDIEFMVDDYNLHFCNKFHTDTNDEQMKQHTEMFAGNSNPNCICRCYYHNINQF